MIKGGLFMPNLKTYDLFISHSWDYNSEYYSLFNNLEQHSNFYFRNYSEPEHDALNTKTDKQLEEALIRQIRPVNVVIVLAGMYVNYRKWIQKEIEIAQYYNKPIIAIRPRGAERMPQDLSDIADIIVNWNTDSIVDAIRKYSI